MEMKDRIKKIRRELDLTQQEFADRIGVKRNSLANYETGRNTPIDAIAMSICREFNVNEEWLRNGTGEMFTKLDLENQLMRWAGNVLKDESDSFRRRFVNMMMGLTEDEWELLERKVLEVVHGKNPNGG